MPMRPEGRDSASRGSLADVVYGRLLREINAGEIGPGDPLREVEVASRLGVSRTPVREAFHRLLSEEIIIKQDRGLIVPTFDDKQIFELYAMRETLEGAAAGLAARSASDAEIDVLGSIVAAEAALPDDAAGRHAALNKEFHDAIYRAANNRYLIRSLNSLQDAIARLQATTFSWPGRSKRAVKEHRQIWRAIAKREPACAESATRAHIREALRTRMLLIHAGRGNRTPIENPDTLPFKGEGE